MHDFILSILDFLVPYLYDSETIFYAPKMPAKKSNVILV